MGHVGEVQVRYGGCGENDEGFFGSLFLRIHVFLFCTIAAEWGRASPGIIGGGKRVPFSNDDVSDSELTTCMYLCAIIENNCVWRRWRVFVSRKADR